MTFSIFPYSSNIFITSLDLMDSILVMGTLKYSRFPLSFSLFFRFTFRPTYVMVGDWWRRTCVWIPTNSSLPLWFSRIFWIQFRLLSCSRVDPVWSFFTRLLTGLEDDSSLWVVNHLIWEYCVYTTWYMSLQSWMWGTKTNSLIHIHIFWGDIYGYMYIHINTYICVPVCFPQKSPVPVFFAVEETLGMIFVPTTRVFPDKVWRRNCTEKWFLIGQLIRCSCVKFLYVVFL